jgi:hypothetical protein
MGFSEAKKRLRLASDARDTQPDLNSGEPMLVARGGKSRVWIELPNRQQAYSYRVDSLGRMTLIHGDSIKPTTSIAFQRTLKREAKRLLQSNDSSDKPRED